MADSAGQYPLDARTGLALERTLLAMERTLLAWLRSAITLITFGFTVHHLFRDGEAGRPAQIGPFEFGFVMIVIGLVGLILASLQHARHVCVLRRRYATQQIPMSNALYLAALVAGLSILGMISVLAA
ncbi:MAG: YidH family protein [Marinibacterium sp.]